MLFTKVTLHQRLQCQWSALWKLWCLTCLFVSWVPLVWAQVLPPGLPAPPLFGQRVGGVVATADTMVDFTLARGSILTGTVSDANGMNVIGATVLAESDTETFFSSVVVSFNPINPGIPQFGYRIVLPDGTYNLFVIMNVIDLTAMPPRSLSIVTFDLQETVVVAGDTQRDLSVPSLPPFFNLTGQVASLGVLPSEGSLFFRSDDGRVSNSAQAEIADGATQATYSVTLPAGTYEVAFAVALPEIPIPDENNPLPPPPADPEVPQQNLIIPIGTVTVSADQVFDINVPATVTLSGKLQDGLGMALAGAGIFAASGLPPVPPPLPPPLSPTRASCQSGALTMGPAIIASRAVLPEDNTLGDYELLLAPGDYQVGVMTPVDLMPPATVPPSTLAPQQGDVTFPFPTEMITITADQLRDFVLPPLPGVVLISGRVVDEQNQPVIGARVNAESSMLTGITGTPNALFSNDVETNELGEYQLLGLSGVDYTVTACPPLPTSVPGMTTP